MTTTNLVPVVKTFFPVNGKKFFIDTIAQAIEVLDMSRKLAISFTKKHSVTKLSKIVEIAKVCDLPMATVVIKSKRPLDHVRNYFTPKLINSLGGANKVIGLLYAYSDLINEIEEEKYVTSELIKQKKADQKETLTLAREEAV